MLRMYISPGSLLGKGWYSKTKGIFLESSSSDQEY